MENFELKYSFVEVGYSLKKKSVMFFDFADAKPRIAVKRPWSTREVNAMCTLKCLITTKGNLATRAKCQQCKIAPSLKTGLFKIFEIL